MKASNEKLFTPLIENGPLLPNIRSIADRTPFILSAKDSDYKKLFISLDGKLEKIGIYPDEPIHFDTLEVDNFFANQFTLRQTNISNGDQGWSDSGIIEWTRGSYIAVKDSSGLNLCPFKANDLIITRQVAIDKSYEIRYVKATVIAVLGNQMKVTYEDPTYQFQKGDTVLRIGNTTDTSRQDSIFLSTDDTYSPYFAVFDGISSFTGHTTASWDTRNPKVLMGNLGAVIDSDFNPVSPFRLSGYGLYAENVYLKGKLRITSNADIIGLTIPNATYTSGDTFPSTPAEGDWHYLTKNPPDSGFIVGWYRRGSSSWAQMGLTGTYIDGTGIYTGTVIADQIISGSINILRIPVGDIKTSAINNDAGWTSGGTVTSSGTTFPASPHTNDLHWYTGATGGSYVQYNWYRYTGSAWSQLGSNGTYIDGSGIYTGTVAANNVVAGTLTGFTIQTAASGQRVVIDGSTNKINFYSSSGAVGTIYGNGAYIQVDGTLGQVGASLTTYQSGGLFEIFDNATGTKKLHLDNHAINITDGTTGGTISMSVGSGSSVITIGGEYVATHNWVAAQGYVTSAVTSVSGSGVISSSGGATPSISISQASNSTSGYLSSTDWNTFYNKQPAGSYLTSETDPVFVASAAHSITSTDITHWDDAYSIANGIHSWALASTKPSYTYSEVGAASAASVANASDWDSAWSLVETGHTIWDAKATASYGSTGGATSPSGYVTLTVNGTSYKLWYQS